MTTIRIATRSSAQARTQAEAVGALLTAARNDVSVEYVLIRKATSMQQRRCT